MKKRWLLRLGPFAGVTVLGFWFVLWLTAPAHHIDRFGLERIQVGMSEDEVVAVIGLPAGNDSSAPGGLDWSKIRDENQNRYFADVLTVNYGHLRSESTEEWECETGRILVWFDHANKVCYKTGIFRETLFDKLRRLMGIQ